MANFPRALGRRLVLLAAVCTVWFAFAPSGASAAARDSDHDGMANRWEVTHNLNAHRANAGADPDKDGLRNIGEFRNRTLPHREDSDLDGIDDGDEVHVFASDPDDADENDN